MTQQDFFFYAAKRLFVHICVLVVAAMVVMAASPWRQRHYHVGRTLMPEWVQDLTAERTNMTTTKCTEPPDRCLDLIRCLSQFYVRGSDPDGPNCRIHVQNPNYLICGEKRRCCDGKAAKDKWKCRLDCWNVKAPSLKKRVSLREKRWLDGSGLSQAANKMGTLVDEPTGFAVDTFGLGVCNIACFQVQLHLVI